MTVADSKRIRYCDDAGVCIHVVVPWGDASGNIPPPVISFGARSFVYDGDEPDTHPDPEMGDY